MATITAEEAKLLCKHGFKWHKEGTTDRVDAGCIKEIIPTEHGFACIYNEKAHIAVSTVILREQDPIDWPHITDMATQWILVNWEDIKDEWKPGKKPGTVSVG